MFPLLAVSKQYDWYHHPGILVIELPGRPCPGTFLRKSLQQGDGQLCLDQQRGVSRRYENGMHVLGHLIARATGSPQPLTRSQA